MNGQLSSAAKSIIDAGVAAAKQQQAGENFSAVDNAIVDAVGKLGIEDPSHARARIYESLLEIVQFHVRQQIGQNQTG